MSGFHFHWEDEVLVSSKKKNRCIRTIRYWQIHTSINSIRNNFKQKSKELTLFIGWVELKNIYFQFVFFDWVCWKHLLSTMTRYCSMYTLTVLIKCSIRLNWTAQENDPRRKVINSHRKRLRVPSMSKSSSCATVRTSLSVWHAVSDKKKHFVFSNI